MTYEARNLASNLGMENLVVTLDYNGFGIDGPIFEVMPAPYVNHWFALGWNVIEADGHNPRELAYAYRLAAEGFGPGRPTVVIAHTRKGTDYGRLEGTGDSHGTPLPHAEYVDAMHKLGFAVPGVKGEVANDIAVVTEALGESETFAGSFDADQHLQELDLAGGAAALTPGGDKVLVTRELQIDADSAPPAF